MTDPRPEPLQYDDTWLDVQRCQIATQAMAAMIATDGGLEYATNEAKNLSCSREEVVAFASFSIADAMMVQATKSPDQRKTQMAKWRAIAKGDQV